MCIKLENICVTVGLSLLAQGLILLLILCTNHESSALNIWLFCLLSLCWVHVFCVALSLTPSHKKSSPRSSVAQTADENIQGAELPCHSNHLAGLIIIMQTQRPDNAVWCDVSRSWAGPETNNSGGSHNNRSRQTDK